MTKLFPISPDQEEPKRKAQATIQFDFSSNSQLTAAIKALEPETRGSPARRFQARVERREKQLFLHLEARDTSALRAVVNSYLNWLLLLRDVCLTLEPLKEAILKD